MQAARHTLGEEVLPDPASTIGVIAANEARARLSLRGALPGAGFYFWRVAGVVYRLAGSASSCEHRQSRPPLGSSREDYKGGASRRSGRHSPQLFGQDHNSPDRSLKLKRFVFEVRGNSHQISGKPWLELGRDPTQPPRVLSHRARSEMGGHRPRGELFANFAATFSITKVAKVKNV